MTRNLRAFLAVVEAGSLTAAARALHITQPTLTKRLQQLEGEYGCRLLERDVRGSRPTPAGEGLLAHARRIEEEHRQSFEAVASATGRELATLRIGAGPLFHLRYLSGALARLREEFPGTRIVVEAGLNKHNLPRLERGELDLVFGTRDGSESSVGKALAFEPMTSVEQGVVVREGHPVTRRKAPTAASLARLPWILYGDSPDDAWIAEAFFRREGKAIPPIDVQTSSFTLGLQLVESSDAAMTVPVALAPFIEEGRALCVLATTPSMARFDGGAFHRRATRGFRVVRRLLDLVGEGLRD